VNFLQTGNERLNDTSKMVHKSQLNFLERNEAKRSRIDEEKEAEDTNKVKKSPLLGMSGNSINSIPLSHSSETLIYDLFVYHLE